MVEVILLKEVDTNEANETEIYYISKYRKINPNLLNEANGENWWKYYFKKTDEEKKSYW